MDKKKSILNVTVSIGFKLLLTVLGLLVKRTLIQHCGNDVNGLNALYLSIIGVLAVAELGIGSAITFCMYKPIVDGAMDEVAGLYRLFLKAYRIIGGIIFGAGLLLAPFIQNFAKDYAELNVNFSLTFLIMLISVVMSYMFSAKTSLINAYKNNYITTTISSCGMVLQYVLQITVLACTKSFQGYLLCRIVAIAVQWVITEIVTKRKYHAVLVHHSPRIEPETRQKLSRSIRAMFMHNIGRVLVNTIDSLVISIFIGVVVLGKYSNYQTILSSVTHIIALVFSSLTSVLGHLYVQKKPEVVEKYCRVFHTLNFCIGTIFYLGFFAVADQLVELLFDRELVVAREISFVIALNGFVQFMRNSVLTFRNATGVFYNDRWKPLVEGVVNMVLSVLLVKSIGVIGVLVATIMTTLLICHVIEPFVLYKYAFNMSPRNYYLSNYSMILIYAAAQVVMEVIRCDSDTVWQSLLTNGMLSVCISLAICALGAVANINLCKQLLKRVRRK